MQSAVLATPASRQKAKSKTLSALNKAAPTRAEGTLRMTRIIQEASKTVNTAALNRVQYVAGRRAATRNSRLTMGRIIMAVRTIIRWGSAQIGAGPAYDGLPTRPQLRTAVAPRRFPESRRAYLPEA